MKESSTSQPIVITDEDPENFEKMIKFLYVQKLEVQSFQDLLTMAELAHMYCAKTLLLTLTREIVESMTFENFFDVFEMSLTFSLPELTQGLVSWLFWSFHKFSEEQIEELKPLRKQISESFVGWEKLLPNKST